MRLKSPASRLFTQSLIQAQIKENIKAPRHWPLCGEFTGTGEFPAKRASNAEMVPFDDVIMGFDPLAWLAQSYTCRFATVPSDVTLHTMGKFHLYQTKQNCICTISAKMKSIVFLELYVSGILISASCGFDDARQHLYYFSNLIYSWNNTFSDDFVNVDCSFDDGFMCGYRRSGGMVQWEVRKSYELTSLDFAPEWDVYSSSTGENKKKYTTIQNSLYLFHWALSP